MTIVVLGLIGGSWVTLYIGADMGLYLIVKLLRGDFWYWVPLGGKAEIVMSLVTRVLVKVVTDFTSIVQSRHPNEVGGFYWSFGFVLTMGSLPLTIIISGPLLPERAMIVAWAVTIFIIPCSLVCFATFFFNIEKNYWHTFFDFKTGVEFSVHSFKNAPNDAAKAAIAFGRSKRHWVSIEAEVRAWIEANWERWQNGKPGWFTDSLKEKVPLEFIPTTEDARRRESVRRASVDAEADESLGDSLRASIRRASVGLEERNVKVVPIEMDN
jgi:hypothetical protein